MSYKKVLVDNVTCSRRFHVTFDDEAAKVAETKAECPYCGITIFSAQNHPPVKVARQENLVKTTKLSDQVIKACEFKDVLSERTIPKDLNKPVKDVRSH